eukprot:SAG31_NODE_4293_length_3375_cov_6.098901_1_plen_1019_part_10
MPLKQLAAGEDFESRGHDVAVAVAVAAAETAADVEALLAAAPAGAAMAELPDHGIGEWGIENRKEGDVVVLRAGRAKLGGRNGVLWAGQRATVTSWKHGSWSGFGESYEWIDMTLTREEDGEVLTFATTMFNYAAELATARPRGWRPLHLAAFCDRPAAVVGALLAAGPSVAGMPDESGKLPLNLAIAAGCNMEALALLHAAHQTLDVDVLHVDEKQSWADTATLQALVRALAVTPLPWLRRIDMSGSKICEGAASIATKLLHLLNGGTLLQEICVARCGTKTMFAEIATGNFGVHSDLRRRLEHRVGSMHQQIPATLEFGDKTTGGVLIASAMLVPRTVNGRLLLWTDDGEFVQAAAQLQMPCTVNTANGESKSVSPELWKKWTTLCKQVRQVGAVSVNSPDTRPKGVGGSSDKTGLLTFPKQTGVKINMMPFVLGDWDSIPKQYQQYRPFIEACPTSSDDVGRICYLTIDEGFVEKGQSQRRGGLHVESPGKRRQVLQTSGQFKLSEMYVTSQLGEKEDEAERRAYDEAERAAEYDSGYVCYGPATPFPPLPTKFPDWSKTAVENNPKTSGGLYMASSVDDSCRVWDTSIAPMVIGNDGDIEHLRNVLDRTSESRTLKAGELVFMSDLTPHEVLPQKASSERTYFRLIVGKVSIWDAKISTPNPLGIQPDAEITFEDKFAEPVAASLFEGLVHPAPRSKLCFVSVPDGDFLETVIIPETKHGDLSAASIQFIRADQFEDVCANPACDHCWSERLNTVCPECGHPDQQWFAAWKLNMAKFISHSESQRGLFVLQDMQPMGRRQKKEWDFVHNERNGLLELVDVVTLSEAEAILEGLWSRDSDRSSRAVLSYSSDLVQHAHRTKTLLSEEHSWPEWGLYVDGDFLASRSDTTIEVLEDDKGNRVLDSKGNPRYRVLNDKWHIYYREAMVEAGTMVFLTSWRWCQSPWCNLELLWFLLLRASGHEALMAAPTPKRTEKGHELQGELLPELRADVKKRISELTADQRSHLMDTAFFCTYDE